ncbi:capsular biosynthesis protein, partial [Campylobacter jejuni]|nr:capsular biosynthesis protein [Campylobacter jejuni]
MQTIKSKLQLSLQNWDFNTLENYYELLVKNNKNHMDYIVYLYETGQIKKIKKILNSCQNEPNWWVSDKINISYENLVSIINSKEMVNLSDVSIGCFACLQLNSSIYNGIVDIELLCKNFLYEYSNKMSRLSKKYYISKIIDLALSGEKISKNEIFNNENQIKDYLFFANLSTVLLNDFNQDYGSRIYYKKCNYILKSFLFRNKKIHTPNRIALCISGAARGNWLEGLKDVIKTFSQSFKVDCFLFTWKEAIEWPALCGGGYWVKRLLDPAFDKIADEEIKKDILFKKFFPNVYSILNKEFYSQDEVSAIQLDGISEIKSYVIERQKDFEDRYGKVVNNSKLNYGIFRAFELMEEYEKQNNFKYDFVIRLRPDAKYITNLDLKRLNEVNNGELALKIFPYQSGTPKDFAVYGRRNTMEVYSKIWYYAFFNKDFDFFEQIPKVLHNHHVARNWILLNNFEIVQTYIEEKLTGESLVSNGYIMPNISREIYLDLLKLQGKVDNKKLNRFEYFFQEIMKKYGKIENNVYLSALQRVRNHLCYKFGVALIENSKSILGYIRMPYVLSHIKDKHKQEQKAYEEKIKENPNLALPPLETYPDYNEALKEKECFTYKLGQEFIKASQNWY